MNDKQSTADRLERWDAFDPLERRTLLNALDEYIEVQRKVDFGDVEVYRTANQLWAQLVHLRMGLEMK